MPKRISPAIAFFLILIIPFILTKEAHAISWKKSIKSAIKEAKKHNKPIMVDFYASWCQWCKELDNTTYSNRKVNNFSKRFVCVKINGQKNTDVIEKYGVKGYPTVMFLSPHGAIDTQVIGYRPPAVFLDIMESVLNKMKNAQRMANRGLELNGIIMNKKKKLIAVVNNVFVKEGDVIANGRVSKITKNRVEVAFADKTIVLTMD